MTSATLGGRLQEIVLKRIGEDRLVLPAMPSVVAKALALIQQSEGALKQAATLLAGDPVLSVQLVRQASAISMGTPVRGVEQAVTRLGAQKLRAFLVEVGARKLFESRDKAVGEACRGLWAHSVAVGLLARDLAALCGSQEAEMAYLAGLLHDLGKPILGSILLEAERLLAMSRPRGGWILAESWLQTVSEVHRPVGVALAERWGLPDQVVAAIRDCGDYDPSDRLCVANFVRFANAVSKDKGLFVGPCDIDDARALIMVGRSVLGVDDAILSRLLDDLGNRVQAQLQVEAPSR